MNTEQKSPEQRLSALKEAGYRAKRRTLTAKQAAVRGFCFSLPFLLLFGGIYRIFLVPGAHLLELGGWGFYLPLIAVIAVSAVVHELLHGIGWAAAGKTGWENIQFRFSALMPTCACKAVLPRGQYLFGVLLPFLVLGSASVVFMFVYPGTISLLTVLTNFIGAGADLVIARNLLREDKSALILDPLTEAGYIACSKA